MSHYRLQHAHSASECGVVFASFKAFRSPLRGRATVASCHFGTHRIWWDVEAATETEALAQLPRYIAERTTAIEIRELRTP